MRALKLLSVSMILASSVAAANAQSNIKTVFIILMENHNWTGGRKTANIKGNPDAPYINNTLLPMASHAEQYFNPPGIHPSLPNYLWLEAGTNFSILDDNPPSVNSQSTNSHLVTLLNTAGISWKAYEEDISGTVCPLTDVAEYAVQSPMIGILQDPHFKCALAWVKTGRSAENIKENRLDHFLGLTRIAHDSRRYAEDEQVISVKENRQSISTARGHRLNEIFV